MRLSAAQFSAGAQVYGEVGSEDKWSQRALTSRAAILAGVYTPQVFLEDFLDFRIEYADTDLSRRKTGIPAVWYNNATSVSGVRFRGFPIGHHMGTDAIDLFVRTTRHLGDGLQLGANFNWQERDRGQSLHETKREAAVELTVGYTFQRIRNPGQITSINPFVETFVTDVTSNNHFLWRNLGVQC